MRIQRPRAFCFNCEAMREMTDLAVELKRKTGSVAIRGTCVECRRPLYMPGPTRSGP